ncbi:gamma-glutamyl-gamma-aminobutyrate hydrolase family protein [Microvirga sp. HBU67558]|uniref:gamma-glutamyl-gamma-aminobutyrate hydrolase family protein n=1 Tax=Microvirga TaxID=186650 RepID=UPI001B398966|nr:MULTISPECIES: gamma-glutamyl-gamma-aminobutyrate hydrolase family protein [unclassified Microvirga]MBQ0820642.1 gamma-glutamyl-gamma-aminobutyrate hydrolase family protein [Microvirga sp. HBU67558]
MPHLPRIAIIMDENTSVDGTRYDMTKAYFVAIQRAGGLPFGIPYVPEMIEPVIDGFDGFLSVGGRFAFPDSWFVDGQVSKSPRSERLDVEIALMRGFLERDKPALGICNGMQVLAALHGCRLSPDLRTLGPDIMDHDRRGTVHKVAIERGTLLSRIVGQTELTVNTFHREAVVTLSDRTVASARAEDGIIEAIEIPDRRFAIGVQWHQELFAAQDHPGNRLFEAFVHATR